MKIKILFVLSTLCLLIVTACSNVLKNEEQKILVQKRIGDEKKYEDFKEITTTEEVQRVSEVLDKASWERNREQMSRSADYTFNYQFNNPEIELEALFFEVWIDPEKETLMIVSEDHEYTQLTKESSKILFDIINKKEETALR